MTFVRITIAAAALLLVGGLAWAETDEDSFGEPEIADPLEPADLTVGFEDPGEMRGHSERIRDHHADTEDPTEMVVGAEDLHDMRGEYEDPAKMRGDHDDISELEVDDGDSLRPHPTPKLVDEPSPPGPNASSTERALWRELESAETNLDASVGVYRNMMNNDYPRGERRQRIVDERDAAIEAVNHARTRYVEAGTD